MSDARIDIPPPSSPNFEEKVREALSVYLGKRGDKLDRGVTLRDLVDAGVVELRGGYLTNGGKSPIIGPGTSITQALTAAYNEDLTPPPTPTGTTVTAGLSYIYLKTDDPTFTVGNGYARTKVYGVKNAVGSPLFSSAQLIHEFVGSVGSFPSDTGTQWNIWMKWETLDGVTSTLPSGLPNGQVATTGKIGNTDLGPLIVEAGNLASGAVSASKLASDAVTAGVFAPGYEPLSVVTSVPGAKTTSTVFNSTDGKLYRWNGTAYVASVPTTDLAGQVIASQIDEKGLDILDLYGNEVFSHTGAVSSSAYVTVSGNNITLSTVAANALVPSLNYVGTYATAPTSTTLGANWKQNAVYKNSADGNSYVLTGTPLGWVVYLADGLSFILTVESTNGTVFRVGQSSNTLLKARLFKNGAEVTDVTPAGWFRWRRVSAIPQAAPNDDTTWNNLYVTGYKQVSINVDDVYARATFFCDIISS